MKKTNLYYKDFSVKGIALENSLGEQEDGLLLHFGGQIECENRTDACGGTLTLIYADKDIFDSSNCISLEERTKIVNAVDEFLSYFIRSLKVSLKRPIEQGIEDWSDEKSTMIN